jgi:hypothetical protein
MQPKPQRAPRWMPLLALAAIGLLVGVGLGYLVWGPGAADYGVVSGSKVATRTARVGGFSVTFPSAVFAKAGNDTSIPITITNLRGVPASAGISLALASNSGIDTATISTLTANPYVVTLAAYGGTNYVIASKPSGTGYAFFDLIVDGESAGSIALYVVPT